MLILSEFAQNLQHPLVLRRLPTLTEVDMASAEANAWHTLRIADFSQAYKYTGNKALQYLFYLRQFQNLFDLEFFANKIPSTSYSIAGLEQSVMSGQSFWEDSSDLDDLSADEYLDNSAVNEPMYADQSDTVDSPHRN